MIESCTKRRMIISVVALGVLTLVILVLEEALTSGPINQSPTPYSANQSSAKNSPHNQAVLHDVLSSSSLKEQSCWLEEDFEILEACAPCTRFEINSQSPLACVETGLKEKLKCKTYGVTFRSCALVKSTEAKKFLTFMFGMLLLFVLSLGSVKLRISQLERQAVKNIEKRLAVGH